MIEMLETRRFLSAAPVLAGIEAGAINYTEGNTTALTSSLTVSDADSTDLAHATVAITGNYQSGQDILAFTNTANITGSFNATTGILTLTGSDTVADYQAALRAVTYHTNDNPNSSVRTVSFTANDGTNDSNVETRTINVTPVNNPPVMSGVETTPLQVSANGSATAITSTLLVTDADNNNLTGATVKITSGYQNGKDVLAFTTIGAISGTFDTTTGTLTLTGTDTVSNYRAALRSVTYQNKDTAASPVTTKRTISFQTADAGSTPDSNTVTRDVAINPVLTGIETTPLSYSVNNDSTTKATTPITATLTIDADPSTTITGATVKITGNYQSGQDVLAFTNASGITGSFNAATGTMTLTGTASIAAYQAALRSVTYHNSSASTTGQTRTVTFTVTDSNSASSNSVTRDIAVTSSTVVSGLETTAISYTEGQAAVPLTSTITVSDPNGTTLSGATIKLTGFQTGDVLAFKNTSAITGTYNSTTGILTLTGKDTLANYQAALRAITFQNTTNNPGSAARSVSIQVGTTLLTTAVTRSINVTAIVSVPVLSKIEQRILRHRHRHGPSVVAPNITITVTDSTTLTGAKVQIGNFHAGKDVLAFTKAGSITGTFDATTGILTLTGTDTIANYEAVLRSVTFNSTGRHIHGRRQITFEVSNGTTQSVAGERTVRVR